MSLNSEKSRVQYEGNGSTTAPYPVTFVFFEPTDLKVVVTNATGQDNVLTLGSGYSVTGAGSSYGGNVATLQAYDASHKVTIYREVEATQKTVYEENADFPAKSHERALDKLTMLVQQIGRKVRQGLRLRESDGETPETAKVANSLFGLGADGAPLFRSADEVASFLNLSQQYFDRPIKTFANASERALSVPEFIGQIGSQRDDATLWFANGVGIGNWTQAQSRVSLAMLLDGVLENSPAGRAKMADGYLSADAAGRAKMADAFLTLAKIGAGIFTSDPAGRAPFASGYIDPTLCAPNLWTAIAPAGAIINSAQASYALVTTFGLPAIPTDNSIPQIGEGTQILSVTLQPHFTTSTFRLRVTGWGGNTVSNQGMVVACFRGAINVGASYYADYSNSGGVTLSADYFDEPATLSTISYTVRVGPATSGAVSVNSLAGASLLGGASSVKLVVEEIKN